MGSGGVGRTVEETNAKKIEEVEDFIINSKDNQKPTDSSRTESPESSTVLSLRSSSGIFCRICHEGDHECDKLISPCSCTGSVGLIHRACIEKWLSTVNQDSCEICREKFLVSRHSRSFTSWLLTPAVGDDQRNLLGDSVCFLLLTPLTTISSYLCASGAAFYFKMKRSEALGLICLACLLVLIYLVWLLLTIRYHCQVWFKWRLNNQDIRLLDVSSNRPAPPRPGNVFLKVEEVPDTIVEKETEVSQDVSNCEESRMVQATASSDVDSGKKEMLTYDYETSTPDQRSAHSHPVVGHSGHSAISRIIPLSPVIISTDPQADNSSVVVSSTADSDIYAQIPRLRSTPVSYPYIPEMKHHFLTVGSSASRAKVSKSRGTFSPHSKSKSLVKSPLSSYRESTYERIL